MVAVSVACDLPAPMITESGRSVNSQGSDAMVTPTVMVRLRRRFGADQELQLIAGHHGVRRRGDGDCRALRAIGGRLPAPRECEKKEQTQPRRDR